MIAADSTPPRGPGFITVTLDVPFGLGLPNGGYLTLDPIKGLAVIQPVLREGARSFFRVAPIIGPTSFEDLKAKARQYERPREAHSYTETSTLQDGSEKATLNIHCGADGGFAETRYYSEIQITFLEDDLGVLGTQGYLLTRATDILNPFLDKYRLLVENYRVSRVTGERNFYLAVCYTSPLQPEELGLSAEQLIARLPLGRTFSHRLGQGAANIVRTNSLDHLGPPPPIPVGVEKTIIDFVQRPYEMPLSYDLVMQALRSLQIDRDSKMAIVHAATAVEVHVLHLLHGLLVLVGRSASDAWHVLENDSDYEGVKPRLKRLESDTKSYAEANGLTHTPFVGGKLYGRWENTLAHKRNRAVHAGVASFTWAEAAEAIGIAKETIVCLDRRVPPLTNSIQLNPSVGNLKESAGGVVF